jgi:uncharacterized protein
MNSSLLVRCISLLALLFITVALPSFAQSQYTVKVERNVSVKMRDGVTLRGDIFRPDAEGKFPVLLQRTPYRRSIPWGYDVSFAQHAASLGYVVFLQDVRGRYTSDGEWRPFIHESEDGYDTIEWIASQSYSNGKVGMFGGSYVGATQVLAAIANPPHLAGICPVVTASNYHDGWTYQGGAFEQWFNESWTSGLAQDTLEHKIESNPDSQEEVNVLPLTAYPILKLSPAITDTSASAIAPYFLDWLAHPNYDDYWKRISIEDHFAQIHVPALHIAAWYDIFLGGSLRNYMGIKSSGGSEEARKGQRLLVVIGGHSGGGRKIGVVDFGPEAEKFNENEVMLHWYDFLFKGAQNEFATGKPVKIFVMGSNQWSEEDDWPLARARNTKFFLHSEGSANSSRGNGSLSMTAPASEPADKFVYDPAKPVPTVGGPLCCDAAHLAAGPRDQRSVEERDDVLVYSTPPLEHDLEVTGPVRLDFFASSSAMDTDFTAKLVDVAPDGTAINLAEGILRAKYRDSQSTPASLVPGKVYPLTIDLWSTSNVFRAGHRIRLEVSSSNFPRFDRNLNTGEPAASSSKWVPATNTLLHDAAHPSALLLPIVP